MRPLHGLLLVMPVVVLIACSEVRLPSTTTGPVEPVPGPVAFAVPVLEFTGLEEGWPPRPKGRQNEQGIDTSGLKDLAAASCAVRRAHGSFRS